MHTKTLLAINTVGGSCAVAVGNNQSYTSNKITNSESGYSEILIPVIQKALTKSKILLKQLDGFVVCTGPGNYTSLRVAVSTTRGFALACKKPAVGVSLFQLLADASGNCLVILKGPVDKVYIQEFSNGVVIDMPKLVSFDDLISMRRPAQLKLVGHQAEIISGSIGRKIGVKKSKICFKKFFSLGLMQLDSNSNRPSPIYIK